MYIDDLYFRIVYLRNNKKILSKEYLKSIKKISYFERYKLWDDTKVLRLKIQDTIHFKFLEDQIKWERDYVEYIENSLQRDHTLEKYLTLIKNFDVNRLKKDKIIIFKKFGKPYVFDGNHRISILRFKYGVTELKSEYFKII